MPVAVLPMTEGVREQEGRVLGMLPGTQECFLLGHAPASVGRSRVHERNR